MYTDIMTVTIHQKSILNLRDIREDLQARIDALEHAIDKEQAAFLKQQEEAAANHRKRMDGLKRGVGNYRAMLELETLLLDRKSDSDPDQIGPHDQVKIQMPGAPMPLGDFFCAKLEQFGFLSKEQLRALACEARYFPAGESGGRQTHATLVNITRNGRVTNTPDGYALATKERALL